MLPKIKDFSDYNKYVTDEDYTTSAQAQEFFENQNLCLVGVVASYWQPQTSYAFGDIIFSPGLPKNAQAMCVHAGITSSTEQTYGGIGSLVVDGTVQWQIQHRNAVENGLSVGDSRARANKPTYGL